jgi:hypothetical protein
MPGASIGQASEFGTLTGYTRLSVQFQSASTVNVSQASATNINNLTYGEFSSNGSIVALLVCDNQTVGSTNYLVYGSLLTLRTFLAGDQVVFQAGALTVVLS